MSICDENILRRMYVRGRGGVAFAADEKNENLDIAFQKWTIPEK